MAGIINKQVASEGKKQQAQEAESFPGAEQATPEEQESFERIGYTAMHILYADESHQGFVKMLQDGQDMPAKTLAEVAMLVFSKIDEASGGKIPEVLVIRAAEQVLDLVIELAEKAKIMQVDEKMAGRAVQEMLIIAGEMYGFDPAELQEEIQGMDQGRVQKMVQEQQQIAQESPMAAGGEQ